MLTTKTVDEKFKHHNIQSVQRFPKLPPTKIHEDHDVTNITVAISTVYRILINTYGLLHNT